MNLSVLLSLFVLIGGVTDAAAKGANPLEAEVQTLRTELLAAAAASDKSRLAELIAFPVEYWSIERNRNVEDGAIPNREDFLRRYDTLFTPRMRARLPKAKSESLDNGRYLMSWIDGGSEFTFEMEFLDGIGWRVRAYGIGAA